MLGIGDGEGHAADAGPTAMTEERLSVELVERLVATPRVRDEAVARARALLASGTWCRAEEVAAEMVDCYVARRLP